MGEEELEPGHYIATRDDATGQWSLVGICAECRKRLTQFDEPVEISPRMSFDPPDYREVYRVMTPDSGIFHPYCAQTRFHDEPDRLPPHLRPRTITVWPDEHGVVSGYTFPHRRWRLRQ